LLIFGLAFALLLFVIDCNYSRKAKIAYFNCEALAVEEDVCRFEIPVDDVIGMKVFNSMLIGRYPHMI
jgi:hypothetical protein